MADPIVTKPTRGPSAFTGTSADDVWSAGGQVIAAARLLSGDRAFGQDYSKDLSEVGVPRLDLSGGQLTDHLPSAARDARALRRETQKSSREQVSLAVSQRQSEFWVRASQGDPAAAVSAIYAGLLQPDSIMRVASAASLVRFAPGFELDPELGLDLTASLVAGCFSDSETVSVAAADALAIREPSHPLLLEMAPDTEPDESGDDAHTSVMLHGTWARWNRGSDPMWWQPGGVFNKYACTTARVSPDLYQGPDYPQWSGGHRRRAHRQGAQDLYRWCHGHGGISRLRDVYAHSHGGTVALRAANEGLQITLLILLSVPRLHSDVMWANLGRTISLRSRLDWVLILDGAPFRHPDPVRELGLPSWFSHSATHDPDTWKRWNLPDAIANERALSVLQ
jgi:hypothetical protein